MDQIIRIVYALACAVCTCLFVLFSDKKILDKKQAVRFVRTWMAVAGLTGAAAGWVLYDRIGDHYINAFRIIIMVGVLAGAAYCDHSEKKIPNLFFILLLGDFCVCTLLEWIIMKESLPALLLSGIIAGAIFFVVFLLLRVISKGGIGYGDIKLITGLGFALGIYGCIYVLLIGQLAALIIVIVGLALHKITLKGAIPLAPFLYFGLIGTVITGMF